MTQRTMLLSVDGALLVEIDSPARQYAAYHTGGEYQPLPVPSDARELTVTAPGGRSCACFFRPAVVDAIRDLADAGVDIVWNSDWLVEPPTLEILSQVLGLGDAVRVPADAELPIAPSAKRIDFGPNAFWEHWKVQALVHRVRRLPADTELVLVDSQLDYSSRRLADGVERRARRADAVVGGVATIDTVGIDGRAVAALRSWAAGGAPPLG